ncbi:hypothetical protein EST38_g5846 [Candolleomyces aberdarensis]|uniref:Uncharacterized protein n=1 Tax=Candolleomyces aberdarensis TaxID=2316362 RepID=A0A4Q2DM71_9AGAR|nr:hypothetical protein EST38_g5846 [Candolleomyces aberdarensis]
MSAATQTIWPTTWSDYQNICRFLDEDLPRVVYDVQNYVAEALFNQACIQFAHVLPPRSSQFNWNVLDPYIKARVRVEASMRLVRVRGGEEMGRASEGARALKNLERLKMELEGRLNAQTIRLILNAVSTAVGTEEVTPPGPSNVKHMALNAQSQLLGSAPTDVDSQRLNLKRNVTDTFTNEPLDEPLHQAQKRQKVIEPNSNDIPSMSRRQTPAGIYRSDSLQQTHPRGLGGTKDSTRISAVRAVHDRGDPTPSLAQGKSVVHASLAPEFSTSSGLDTAFGQSITRSAQFNNSSEPSQRLGAQEEFRLTGTDEDMDDEIEFLGANFILPGPGSKGSSTRNGHGTIDHHGDVGNDTYPASQLTQSPDPWFSSPFDNESQRAAGPPARAPIPDLKRASMLVGPNDVPDSGRQQDEAFSREMSVTSTSLNDAMEQLQLQQTPTPSRCSTVDPQASPPHDSPPRSVSPTPSVSSDMMIVDAAPERALKMPPVSLSQHEVKQQPKLYLPPDLEAALAERFLSSFVTMTAESGEFLWLPVSESEFVKGRSAEIPGFDDTLFAREEPTVVANDVEGKEKTVAKPQYNWYHW